MVYSKKAGKTAPVYGIDVALACLYFCQCASGYITAVGLEPGGKLFLGQAKGFPYTPNLLAYDKVICIVHAITPICTYIRTNFSLILAYCCGIIALILVQ